MFDITSGRQEFDFLSDVSGEQFLGIGLRRTIEDFDKPEFIPLIVQAIERERYMLRTAKVQPVLTASISVETERLHVSLTGLDGHSCAECSLPFAATLGDLAEYLTETLQFWPDVTVLSDSGHVIEKTKQVKEHARLALRGEGSSYVSAMNAVLKRYLGCGASSVNVHYARTKVLGYLQMEGCSYEVIGGIALGPAPLSDGGDSLEAASDAAMDDISLSDGEESLAAESAIATSLERPAVAQHLAAEDTESHVSSYLPRHRDDFGVGIGGRCVNCHKFVLANRGCKTCNKHICKRCYQTHNCVLFTV